MKRLLFIFTLIFCMSLPAIKAQVKDSTIIARDSTAAANDSIAQAKRNRKKIYSIARKSTLMSAILPGLGQAYNKKYWKVPVIYAGLIGFGYLFVTNNTQYRFYRKNLIAFYDNDSSTVNTTQYSGSQLETLKTDFKKNRDLGLIGMGIIYLVNIIDANVDGHLRTFDVSDDLSISVDPWQNIYRSAGYKTAMGLSIKFNFK